MTWVKLRRGSEPITPLSTSISGHAWTTECTAWTCGAAAQTRAPPD
jgi:hypothetical protein